MTKASFLETYIQLSTDNLVIILESFFHMIQEKFKKSVFNYLYY